MTDGIKLSWDTSYAGNESISHYEIVSAGTVIEKFRIGLRFPEILLYMNPGTGKEFKIVAVDA